MEGEKSAERAGNEGRLEGCVSECNGDLAVDWEKMILLRDSGSKLYSEILGYLESRGILTNFSENSYAVYGLHLNLGLIADNGEIFGNRIKLRYFKREKDAMDYASALRKKHPNPIGIGKIIKIF